MYFVPEQEAYMRRGCISLGEVQCDTCQHTMPIYARYLVIEEDDDGKEADKGKLKNYCISCARTKGYATVKDEKGEKTLTFFA
jgi:hypothetical protein